VPLAVNGLAFDVFSAKSCEGYVQHRRHKFFNGA
jgi:hypothetical protein